MKIIKCSALVTACLALMTIAPAQAANWVHLGTGANNSDVYYDSSTIQRSERESPENKSIVWVTWDLSRVKNATAREVKVHSIYDCIAGTKTDLAKFFYFPNGDVEHSQLSPSQQTAVSIPPDTMEEIVLSAVCE